MKEAKSQESPVASASDKQTVVEPKLSKDKTKQEIKENLKATDKKEAVSDPSESTKTDNSKVLENSNKELKEKEQSKSIKEQGETKTTTNTNDSNTAKPKPQVGTNEKKNVKQNTADSTTKTISSPKPTKKLEKFVNKTSQDKTDSAKLAAACKEVKVCINKGAIQENKKPVELITKQNTTDTTTKSISSPKPTTKIEKLATKATQDKTDSAKLVDTSNEVKLRKEAGGQENKIEPEKTQSTELLDSAKDPKIKDDVNKKETHQDSPQRSRKAANITKFADASKEGEVKEAVTAEEEKIQPKRTRKSKVDLDASKAEEKQLNETTVKPSNETTVQPTETSRQTENTNLINTEEPVAEENVEDNNEFVIEPRITRSRMENIKSNESITKEDTAEQTTAEKLAKPKAEEQKLETVKQGKKNVLKEDKKTENISLEKDSNEKTQQTQATKASEDNKTTAEGARGNELETEKGKEHFEARITRKILKNQEDIKAETDKEKTDITNVESSRENNLTRDELTSQKEENRVEARKLRTRGVAKVAEEGKETNEITKIEAGKKSSAPEDLKNQTEKELAELKSQDTNEVTHTETSEKRRSASAESNIQVENEHVETRKNRKRTGIGPKVELEKETKESTQAEQNDETSSAPDDEKNQKEEEHFEPRKKRKCVDLKTALEKETKEITVTQAATQEQKEETLEPIKSRKRAEKVKETTETTLNETLEDDSKNQTEEGRFELRKTRSQAEAKEKAQGESQEETSAKVEQDLQPIKTRKRGDLTAEIGKETTENTRTESQEEKSSAQHDSKHQTEKEHFEPRKTRRLADVKEKSGKETAELSPVESAAHDDSTNQTEEQPLEPIKTQKGADVKETTELRQQESQEENSSLQHDDKHQTGQEHFEARKTRRHADVKVKSGRETTELTQVESSAHDDAENQMERKREDLTVETGKETAELKQTELPEDKSSLQHDAKHQTEEQHFEQRKTRKRADIKAELGKETTTKTQTELSEQMTPEQDLKDQAKHNFEPIKTRRRAEVKGETAKETTDISQAETSSGKSPKQQDDSKTQTENVNTRKHAEIKTDNSEDHIVAVVNQIEQITSTADEMQSKDNSDEVKQTESKEILTKQLDSSSTPEMVAKSSQDSLSLEADMSGSESSITSSNSDNTLRRTLRKRATETPLPENDHKKKLFKEPPLKSTALTTTTPRSSKFETATVIGSTTIKRLSRSPALVAENPPSIKKSTLDTSRKSSRFRNLHDDCLAEEELPIVTADVSGLSNDLDDLHEQQAVLEPSQNKTTEKVEKSLKNTNISVQKSEEKVKDVKQTTAKVLQKDVLEFPKKSASKEISEIPKPPLNKDQKQATSKESSQVTKKPVSKEVLQVPKQPNKETKQVPKQPANKETTQVPKQTVNKESSQVSKQLVDKDPLLIKSRVIVNKKADKTETSSTQKQTTDLAKTNKAKVNISPNKSPGSNVVLSFSDWLKTKRQNDAASSTAVDEKITPTKVDQNIVKAKSTPKTLVSKPTDGKEKSLKVAESLTHDTNMMCQNKAKDLDKTVESKQEHKASDANVTTESMNVSTEQLDNSLLQPSTNQMQNDLQQRRKRGRKKGNLKRLNKAGRREARLANISNRTTVITPSKNKFKRTEIDMLMESMSKEMKDGGISDLLNTDTHVKRQRLAPRKNLYDSKEQLNGSNSSVSSTKETANVSITIANTSASDVILNKEIPRVMDFSENSEVLANTTTTSTPTKRRSQQKGAAKSKKPNTLERHMLNTPDIFSNAEPTPLPENPKILLTKSRKSLNIKELTGQQLKTTENTTGVVKSRKSMPLTSKDTLDKVTNVVVASSRKSLVIPKQQQTAIASDKSLTNVFKTPKLPAHSNILNEIPNSNNIKKLYDGNSSGKRSGSHIRLHLTSNLVKKFKCRKLSVRLNRSTVKKYLNAINNSKQLNLSTTQPNLEDTVNEVPANPPEVFPIIQNNFETDLHIQSIVEADTLLNTTAITAAPTDTLVTSPAQSFMIPNTDTLLTYNSIATPTISPTQQSYVLPTTSEPLLTPLPTTTLLNVGDTNETIELKNEFVDENPIGLINEAILPDTPTLLARAQSITEAAQHALSSSITPTDIRLLSTDSAANSFVASFGVTPTVLDNRGTCMYTFLHPAKYNRNHSNVLLDYCCPNLDGPMPAIDPTRIHAQVQVPVIELPASIVLTTKVVTRADLESGSASIPAIIRRKAEKIRKNLATHTKIAVATTAASAQPPGVVPVMSQPRATLPPTINALTKQLPATTTITAKMRPALQSDSHIMASQPPPPPPAALTQTPTLSSTLPATSSTISVMPKGDHMLQLNNVQKSSLRSNLRRFDVLLKQLVQPFESLTFVDRHRIIEALIATGKFSPNDLDQTLELMEEYIKQTSLLSNESLSQATPTPTSAILSSNNYITTQTAITSSLPSVQMPQLQPSPSILASGAASSTAATYSRQLEQIHNKAVRKVQSRSRNTSLTSPASAAASGSVVVKQRQVPIYDTDRNIIGYQMQMMTPLSTIPAYTKSTMSSHTGAIMSTSLDSSSNKITSYSVSKRPMKRPAQESPRVFYTTPPLKTSTPKTITNPHMYPTAQHSKNANTIAKKTQQRQGSIITTVRSGGSSSSGSSETITTTTMATVKRVTRSTANGSKIIIVSKSNQSSEETILPDGNNQQQAEIKNEEDIEDFVG